MTTSKKISIKWLNNGEFRRFAVEVTDKEDAYAALWRTLLALEPTFVGRVGWKDSDGDVIVVASDCEMQEAIGQGGDVLRLYTVGETPVEKMDAAPTTKKCPYVATPGAHVGVECDACGVNPIVGVRYKCVTCPDYDLCAKCHDEKKHDMHSMVRIADVNDHSWRAMFHHRGGPHGRFGGGGGRRSGRGCGFGGHQSGGPPSFGPKSHSFDHFGAMFQNMGEHFNKHASAMGDNPNEYLKNVGQAVADALGNIGIDVDVDVEDKDGKRDNVKKETKGEATTDLIDMEKEAEKTTKESDTPVVTQPTPEVQVFDNGQWQFVDKTTADVDMETVSPPADGKLYPSVAPSAPPIVAEPQTATTSSAAIPNLEAAKTLCLAHLLNMGFTNDNGWLEAIVEAKHGDLNAVLSALQRK